MASHTLSIVILSKQLVNLPKQRRVNSGERQRLVIERHWNFPDALDWVQKEAELKGILAMP